MFQTGLRIGEIISLRYEDITEDGEWIHVQRLYRYEEKRIIEHTKETEGDRFVPLTDHAIEVIEAIKRKREEKGLDLEGYIFSVDDKPVPYQSVQYMFYRCCEKLGITKKSPNKSRKTYISALIDEGVNINTIRELVGHVDEQTTLHNYCFDRDSKKTKRDKVNNALSGAFATNGTKRDHE